MIRNIQVCEQRHGEGWGKVKRPVCEGWLCGVPKHKNEIRTVTFSCPCGLWRADVLWAQTVTDPSEFRA